MSTVFQMNGSSTKPKVAILMATYNGQHYLPQQVASLRKQTYPEWELYVSDDGSSDGTLDLLAEFASSSLNGRLRVFAGPRKGFAYNFMSLLRRDEVDAGYFAFCDQDDLWRKDKLARGLALLQELPPGVPGLYCSRTHLIDDQGNDLGFSPLFGKAPCFANALVQSIAGGNTMIFNRVARDLLATTPDDITIVSHDWWAYLLISGCGGRIFYDAEATLDYRQHGSNLVGANASWRERLVRLRKMFSGRFRDWNDDNLIALSFYQAQLTAENREKMRLFALGRNASIWQRLHCIHKAGVFRQTLVGNLGLWLATVLKRV